MSLLDEEYWPLSWRLGLVSSRLNDPSESQGEDNSNDFILTVNTQHFRPDEVNIKIKDKWIVIHAKHEERQDEHGFIAREFTRRIALPDDVDQFTITSSMSPDGVLIMKAPRKPPPRPTEVVIPIIHE
ncbi:alpha-crystallin B chain-like isoform X3 [Pomacea canaliculata]|uniref:alpha-crystallin B chain-like isoform X3 n=1 Tax=Pomacea canaliculata TaxID=400727 RepID=UPI000D726C38|nr:alpha-crystallin B chain-like isoform X3 [Pomacea canaliculata]